MLLFLCTEYYYNQSCAQADCDDEDELRTDPEDCEPTDTGTPGTGDDDDDDPMPGDDDDDVTPGDDDDDGPDPTDGTVTEDTGPAGPGAATDGCSCAEGPSAFSPWAFTRRR